jgi:hypothetical protein
VTARFERWIQTLEEDVIQQDFGYEPGEFTVYPTLWRRFYDEGLTPPQAWQRALDAHANGRVQDECERAINYARIKYEDSAPPSPQGDRK